MEIQNIHLPSDPLHHNYNTTHPQLYSLPRLYLTLTRVLFAVHSRFEHDLRLLRRYITSTMSGIPVPSKEGKLKCLFCILRFKWNAHLSDGVGNSIECIAHCYYSLYPYLGSGNSTFDQVQSCFPHEKIFAHTIIMCPFIPHEKQTLLTGQDLVTCSSRTPHVRH